MSEATVDTDFFRDEAQIAPPGRSGSSYRGIQSVVSRISPQLLVTVMDATAPGGPFNRTARRGQSGTTPLTIFFNGSVTAFDVTPDEAERIIRLVEASTSRARVDGGGRAEEGEVDLGGHLPIARRKSLRRFMEKRKERYWPLQAVLPAVTSPH
ncbi:unnamed protein product [Spirodela intermedia]|uniref:Protein TIFY n=2 Tax=Spirodela intermedia TaxID=51605 RepID=A0A7I8IST5_SPIIN|nr:unnamed protein product [Spirodela intermedia]CAA6660013.1 unnamed protein product [Spirodela intermedia]CAA7396328.1 unnamed protein product [Spirodela intermedia]